MNFYIEEISKYFVRIDKTLKTLKKGLFTSVMGFCGIKTINAIESSN